MCEEKTIIERTEHIVNKIRDIKISFLDVLRENDELTEQNNCIWKDRDKLAEENYYLGAELQKVKEIESYLKEVIRDRDTLKVSLGIYKEPCDEYPGETEALREVDRLRGVIKQWRLYYENGIDIEAVEEVRQFLQKQCEDIREQRDSYKNALKRKTEELEEMTKERDMLKERLEECINAHFTTNVPENVYDSTGVVGVVQ